MIIRDIHYNISSIEYSVHFKNKPMNRVRLRILNFLCTNVVVIEKSYWKNKESISKYYVIKEFITSEKEILELIRNGLYYSLFFSKSMNSKRFFKIKKLLNENKIEVRIK